MIRAQTTCTIADAAQRVEIIEELFHRYGGGLGRRNFACRLRFWRKKYAWLSVVGCAKLLKRVIDIVGAVVMLVVLSPVFALAAISIKLTDGGPVLFWQTRVGLYGREFLFPKLRSMVLNAEALKGRLLRQSDLGNSITFKMKHDPRITWVGRIIRKLSIDELPQLWCVLKGEMSLVGPRPPVPQEVARYTLGERRRLDVVPGLTCIWQVSGRSNIPFEQQVQLDVQYVQSRSLWFDLKLLLLTLPAVLLGRGAY